MVLVVPVAAADHPYLKCPDSLATLLATSIHVCSECCPHSSCLSRVCGLRVPTAPYGYDKSCILFLNDSSDESTADSSDESRLHEAAASFVAPEKARILIRSGFVIIAVVVIIN